MTTESVPLRTEFPFTLPVGYQDEAGNLHTDGQMRLATAADEILPLRDPRVQSNPAYLSVIVLARVVTQLGTLDAVNPGVIEKLYAADLTYLQELYNAVNGAGTVTVPTGCPQCGHHYETLLVGSGKSGATPVTGLSGK